MRDATGPSASGLSVRDVAALYIAHGLPVVPLAPGAKHPSTKGWVEATFTPADFRPGDNLGIKHGRELVVSDPDCAEAVALAPRFLPDTACVFGRQSRPESKRVWRCDTTGRKTLALKDEHDKTIVELRVGHQDMAPFSTHPSGERLRWYGRAQDGRAEVFYPPTPAEWEALERGTRHLAAAVLAARHWPEEHARHAWCLALAGTLKRAGLNVEEALAVIEAAATHAGDHKVDDRRLEVRSTFERARVTSTGELVARSGEGFVTALRRALAMDSEAPPREVVVTCAADIKPRRVPWLWDQRLPLGMLSLLVGREGSGKSAIAYERAARVTRGQLEGELFGKPRGAVVVATEDSWSHTITPRLMAAGADLHRVFRVSVQVRDYGALELSLPEDIEALEAVIQEREVSLVILDPIISRIGRKLDTHKDADVRLALEPIASLADRARASVLGIMHLNKTATTDPLTAVMGSRAFAAAARAVLFVARDADTRLLCFPKSNLGAEQQSLSFRIEGKTVATDDDGRPITTAEVVWTGVSDRTAVDVLSDQAKGRVRTAGDRATAWLAERLKGGPVESAALKEEAVKQGISPTTLKDAAKKMGVVMSTSGFPARSVWSLAEVEL